MAAKTPKEIENEFIQGLKSDTGKDLQEWMNEIKASGITKRNDAVKWLKSEHGFGQMNASLIMGIYNNGGKPVYGNEDILLQNQLEKYPDMKPVYEKVIKSVTENDPNIRVIIKKTYVSLVKKREIAAINIKKGELRVGFDLGDKPFNEQIQKSKLSGPMGRISHMIVIKPDENFDSLLFELLATSDKRTHG